MQQLIKFIIIVIKLVIIDLQSDNLKLLNWFWSFKWIKNFYITLHKIFYYLFSFLFTNFLFFLNVHILKWGSSPYSTEFFWIMKIYAFLIILSKSSIFADSNIFSAIFVFVSWRSDLLLICSDWIARICWYVYSNLACFPLLSSVVIILHYYNNILHLFWNWTQYFQ